MKRIILLLIASFILVGCEKETYYCEKCSKYHYYYQHVNCGSYVDGYKAGYQDGYGVNGALNKLKQNLMYSQWYVYSQNGGAYSSITYIYDFDLIKSGYITIAYCKLNSDLKPVKCIDYKQYPYEIVTLLNSKTLLLNVYIDNTPVEYIVEFASNISENHMYLHFIHGNTDNTYDCRKLNNPSGESYFFDILY